MRKFPSGATRDDEIGKLDFEGSLHPLVLKRFAEYMRTHRGDPPRPDDDWQKLFGEEHYDVCMRSLWRHFHDVWMEHRGYKSREGMEDALMGVMFNVMAYAYKYLKEKYGDSLKK